jgi:hypothetical protein
VALWRCGFERPEEATKVRVAAVGQD